jgi:tRNA U34 5-methylaminomethyl-2-thiouridine-forming methyltransferase MnmC
VDTLENFELVTLKSGCKSLRSLHHQETFHPATGPLDEARVIHLGQQRIPERYQANSDFVLWDVGFGAAANAVAAIEALKASNCRGEIHSFDRTTSPIEFALLNRQALGYLEAYGSLIEKLLVCKEVEIQPGLAWHLHLGDFPKSMSGARKFPAPNAILYDPYSPATNPDLWSLPHFKQVFSQLAEDTPCILTSYTRSTSMRVALLLAGFYVGVGCLIGEKAETTVATNRLELLANPLDRHWLSRVKTSTNAAPLKGGMYSKSSISSEDFESLLNLSQFK